MLNRRVCLYCNHISSANIVTKNLAFFANAGNGTDKCPAKHNTHRAGNNYYDRDATEPFLNYADLWLEKGMKQGCCLTQASFPTTGSKSKKTRDTIKIKLCVQPGDSVLKMLNVANILNIKKVIAGLQLSAVDGPE